MLLPLVLALAALQPVPADTLPPAATAGTRTFQDADAADMLRRARLRNETTRQEISAYRALARERVSVGVRTLGRDRLLYRRELAARVHWQREGVGRIEVLGAREATPMFRSGTTIPDGVRREVADLAFDPAEERLFDDLLGARREKRSQDEESEHDHNFFRHPLAAGSEADYAYRAGDTTAIRLPDGTTVTLLELQVLPRRSDPRLVRGSFWFDASTHGPVRAVFRLARAFDLQLDADLLDEDAREGLREIPLVARPLVTPIRADLRFLTIEYGLWEQRWWLPRLIAIDASAEVGALLPAVPVRFERAYSEYVLSAEPQLAGAAAPADTLLVRCPPRRRQATVSVGPDGADAELRTDADAASTTGERTVCSCTHGRCRFWTVELPTDSAGLLVSGYLPPSIYAGEESLINGEPLDELVQRLRALAPPMLGLERPHLGWSFAGGDLLRYNRVEGLSVGARGVLSWGSHAGDATVRLGLADLEPALELGGEREGVSQRLRLAGYRRLAAVDPLQQPFGLGNSLSAALLGRDDGDYFRALGVELVGTPPRAAPQAYRWRLFAERQRPVKKETDVSLPHLFSGSRVFRPNLEADTADQVGVAVSLRTGMGYDPAAFRWSAELFVEAAAGTFEFARPALTLSGSAPLGRRLLGALEVAGGTSIGEPPAQNEWLLGGAGSVRGYAPRAASGTAFWRARAELSNPLPFARLVLFSDAGWAGPRQEVQLEPALLSLGSGLSLMDGLLRFDLARSLRGERQWRAELYVNGSL